MSICVEILVLKQTKEFTELHQRIHALSPERRVLLALRLGLHNSLQNNKQDLVGFVTVENEVSTSDLRTFAQNELPQYMVPAQILVLDAFPRTPNGKLDRAALQSLSSKNNTAGLSQSSVEFASDEVEEQLTAIWSDLLNIQQIPIHANFFDLGGQSLDAIRMLARVKQTMEVDIPVSAIIDAPTIARLATLIQENNTENLSSNITSLQTEGEGIPLYFLPLHMHGALHYRHLYTHLGSDRPLYTFQAFNVLSSSETLPTVEKLATQYVHDLRRFQPEGPYLLCGISVAGLIAYEMARQLSAQGTRNVEVILLDTHGPNYPQYLTAGQSVVDFFKPQKRTPATTNNPAGQLMHDAMDIAWYRMDKYYTAWKIRRARTQIDIQSAREWESDKDLTNEHNNPDLSLDQVNTQLGKMTANYLNQPHPYKGDIILYRARLQPLNAKYNPTLGWERYVNGDITIKHVRGNHLGILKRPHVARFAQYLKHTLQELDKKYAI